MKNPLFSDRELLKLIARDSTDAFKILFDQNYSTISRVLLRYSQDPDQIKDWTQEIFVKLWETRKSINFEGINNTKGYLIVLARNHVIKKLRKKKQVQLVFDELRAKVDIADNNLVERFEESELFQAYTLALSKLPTKTKHAYSLNREDGMTYNKIAEKLGISVKTVEAQVSRAIGILRRELANYLS